MMNTWIHNEVNEECASFVERNISGTAPSRTSGHLQRVLPLFGVLTSKCSTTNLLLSFAQWLLLLLPSERHPESSTAFEVTSFSRPSSSWPFSFPPCTWNDDDVNFCTSLVCFLSLRSICRNRCGLAVWHTYETSAFAKAISQKTNLHNVQMRSQMHSPWHRLAWFCDRSWMALEFSRINIQ